MPILVVAVAQEQASHQSLKRLEHEYSLANELDAAWSAQPVALTRYQGHAALILKDPGGELLDRVIEQHKPQDLSRLLPIAIGLASALGQVHRQGLIHKDVKPANALVDDAGHVWLTGFGSASRLPRERQAPAPPEVVAGTLAYIPGTDRAHESIHRYPERPILFGRHLVSDADGRAPVFRRRPIGVGPLSHRASAGSAR
jgi:serine/threonine protein kinase